VDLIDLPDLPDPANVSAHQRPITITAAGRLVQRMLGCLGGV
jgi:hypothetical protein